MENGFRLSPGIVGLIAGWLLGQMGTAGLVTAVILLIVAAHYHGYRIVIEKHETQIGRKS